MCDGVEAEEAVRDEKCELCVYIPNAERDGWIPVFFFGAEEREGEWEREGEGEREDTDSPSRVSWDVVGVRGVDTVAVGVSVEGREESVVLAVVLVAKGVMGLLLVVILTTGLGGSVGGTSALLFTLTRILFRSSSRRGTRSSG